MQVGNQTIIVLADVITKVRENLMDSCDSRQYFYLQYFKCLSSRTCHSSSHTADLTVGQHLVVKRSYKLLKATGSALNVCITHWSTAQFVIGVLGCRTPRGERRFLGAAGSLGGSCSPPRRTPQDEGVW